ncbi:hypothetical protein Mgra_00004024 [Meloidogyne graminicola]|uniref:Uncharacterized protein n=1 Tax=Meloidogyne graminicola TaxID=189291 RepID=A0A8S9ZSW2_9BILA|nr:hypothetical protein Mgra_00004024 [Meloidogyne graminicola]
MNQNQESVNIEENSSSSGHSGLYPNIEEFEEEQEEDLIYDIEMDEDGDQMSEERIQLKEDKFQFDEDKVLIICTSEASGEESDGQYKSYQLPVTEDLFEQCNDTILPYKRKHQLGPRSSELLKLLRERSSLTNIFKFYSAVNQPLSNLEDDLRKEIQKNEENGVIEWGVNSSLLESFISEL